MEVFTKWQVMESLVHIGGKLVENVSSRPLQETACVRALDRVKWLKACASQYPLRQRNNSRNRRYEFCPKDLGVMCEPIPLGTRAVNF